MILIPQESFQRALDPARRADYIRSLYGTLKLPPTPSAGELPEYAKVLKHEVPRIQGRFQKITASSPLKAETISGIKKAIERNPSLSGANIEFGGGGIPPQSPFEGAFGFFSNGPEGPRFILYGGNDDNWSRQDRLSFLASVLPVLADKKSNKVCLHQDPTTNRIFAARSDLEHNGYYLFEASTIPDLERTLVLPHAKEGEEQQIHLKTTREENIPIDDGGYHG